MRGRAALPRTDCALLFLQLILPLGDLGWRFAKTGRPGLLSPLLPVPVFFRKVCVMRSSFLSPRLSFVACLGVPLFLLGLLCSLPWQGLASEPSGPPCTVQVGNIGMQDQGARDDNEATSDEEPGGGIVISCFYVENLCGNVWTFSGRVNNFVPGPLTVTLSSIGPVRATTIPCLGDGTFLYTADLGCGVSGVVTAVATDSAGNVSAAAANYINGN